MPGFVNALSTENYARQPCPRYTVTMKRFFLLVPLVLSLALTTQTAWACTPPPGGLPHYTTADHVQAAPVVLEGVVSSTTFVNYYVEATVQVVQYLKGQGPALVTISGFGDSSVCLSSVQAGDHLIFLASGDPASGGLQAFYLSQFDATLPADPQTLADAIAAAGQDPVLVAPLETVQTQAAYTVTPQLDATSLVATVNAAAGNPQTTPVPQLALTNAWATVNAATTQVASTQQASVPNNPILPTPTPVPASGTSVEAVALVGVGSIVGLIFGILLGVVGGLLISRWRE